MSVHRQHAHLDAPLEEVWSLVGFPSRYPEWWPRVVEVQGERFEEGDDFVQVTKTPKGKIQSHFLVEQRMFVYMPYEHAEGLAAQEEALRLFTRLAAASPAQAEQVGYARRHHAIIERFGRFPHRNRILSDWATG